MNNEITKEDLMNGVLHIKAKGFKSLIYSPVAFENVEDIEMISQMPLRDCNPRCRRLFDIFSYPDVIWGLSESTGSHVSFVALKPREVNDAFYHEGHFRISK